MNRYVLIGAIGGQLHKYTGVYKNFESVEGNAHLICFGSTSLESDPNNWFIDIMGDTSDPIQWGRSLFYPFHYKWEEFKIVLMEKAEINRLKSQLPNADVLGCIKPLGNDIETSRETSTHKKISSDIYNKNNFHNCVNWLKKFTGPYEKAKETMKEMSQKKHN